MKLRADLTQFRIDLKNAKALVKAFAVRAALKAKQNNGGN